MTQRLSMLHHMQKGNSESLHRSLHAPAKMGGAIGCIFIIQLSSAQKECRKRLQRKSKKRVEKRSKKGDHAKAFWGYAIVCKEGALPIRKSQNNSKFRKAIQQASDKTDTDEFLS